MEKLLEQTFNFSPKDCTFSSFYQKKVKHDYLLAQEEFVDYYRRIKGVIAIYRYGNFAMPGISDIDMIVVFENGYRHRYGVRYDIEYFSPETQYLLNHPQNFLSESLFREVHRYYLLPNLTKLWGKDIPQQQYSEKELDDTQVLNWIDFLVFIAPKSLWKFVLSRKIDTRIAISKLKAIRFSSAFLKSKSYGQNLFMDEFNQTIDDFRKGWFDRDREENLKRLIPLMKEGVALSYKIIEEFGRFIEENFQPPDCLTEYSQGKIGVKLWKDTVYFEKNWNAKVSLQKTVDHYRHNKEYLVTLPFNLSYHFLKYAQTKGSFGELMSKNLFLRPQNLGQEDHSTANQKAEFMGRLIDFLETAKITDAISFNLFHYGYKFYCQRRRGEWRFSHVQRSVRRNLKGVRTFLKARKGKQTGNAL